MDPNEAVSFPNDLATLSLKQLTALQQQALSAFDALAEKDDLSESELEQLETLANGIESVQNFVSTKTASMASTRDAQLARRKKMKPLEMPEMFSVETTGDDEDDDADDANVGETNIGKSEKSVTQTGAEQGTPAVTAGGAKTSPTLAQAQVFGQQIADNGAGNELVITAAAPTSGVVTGSRFGSIDSLVAAVNTHARNQVVTNGRPSFLTVATIQNEFEHVIDGQNTKLADFEHMISQIRNPDRIDSLVAAGGWCAPSEIRYDFFNIACEDGMIDLPTFGVTRGGIQYPVSPSLADVFTGTFTNATNPWLWTEADDILAVTGSPSKPCVRVPCPDFEERRLECYGICLTAGNLTDSAYPEATRNFLSLLMSAHYHAMNQRFIQTMVSLSSAVTVIPTGACRAISSDLPDYIGLAAQDYRTRYGMCDDDVLEVVLPRWTRDAIRSDLARRNGVDMTSVTNAEIDALFTTRRVRIQWVADWQVRGAGLPGGASALTAWPDTVDFMIYAAGTFVKGNGLTLDLGIVRDSVLNESNDHTAAWSEECHLIARYGHESRLYRLPVCVGGLTGGTCSECHVA